MLRKLVFSVICLASILFPTIGRSAIILSIDMDSVTPGIQSTFAGTNNSPFTALVMLQLTGGSSLGIYDFAIRYDGNELTHINRTETPANLGAGYSRQDTTAIGATDLPVTAGVGTLGRLDGGTFSTTVFATSATLPNPVEIGRLNFTTKTLAGNLSDIDITPGIFDTNNNFFFDGPGNDVTSLVTFVGGSITAVPEPSSLALLCGAAVGLIGARRRRT